MGSNNPVHPNDHVNMSQSTNDSFPSAINIAAALQLKTNMEPALKKIESYFKTTGKEVE